jgi:hypothetical protein
MTTTRTVLQAKSYNDLLARVEALTRSLEPHEYLPGTWLRELAVGLAQHDDLVVSVVTYDGGGRNWRFVSPLHRAVMLSSSAGAPPATKPRSRWTVGRD